MDFHHQSITASPSSSTTTSSSTMTHTPPTSDPQPTWWESLSKARTRIQTLSSILSLPLSSLSDSDRPARSLLLSQSTYISISHHLLSSPLSGSGSDPLCQWLYETYQSSDRDLRLVVLSFLPLISGIYLSRVVSTPSDSASFPSLSGFEAVLLSIYSSEVKARGGKPVLISVPDLSQPSLYHTPRVVPTTANNSINSYNGKNNSSPGGSWSAVRSSSTNVGILSPSLEPQVAVKSTKRAGIVGVCFDCYYKNISQMPSWSKVEFCKFVAFWAGQNCKCRAEFDEEEEEIDGIVNGFSEIRIEDDEEERRENGNGLERVEDVVKGERIPLPWELLQPVLRVLGHCLLGPLNGQEVKDVASIGARCLYARASHDLIPQAILATRSLIRLDKRARLAAKEASAAANSASNANTPTKAKKPEVLLVSK